MRQGGLAHAAGRVLAVCVPTSEWKKQRIPPHSKQPAARPPRTMQNGDLGQFKTACYDESLSIYAPRFFFCQTAFLLKG